jgi:predicted O-methyltransferase YrrM
MNSGDTLRMKPSMDILAISKVIEVYRENGYQLLIGNPDRLLTYVARDGRVIEASPGISLSDIVVFQWIASLAPWERALIIGNAFGFSTFIVSGLCPGCKVDAVDAEVGGVENRIGSELTRQIAYTHFPEVLLTIGFSPEDLPKATRFSEYDFILIDGLHTNEQIFADFQGINSLRADNSVVYCHDVGIAKMHEGWSRIREELLGKNDEAFELHFTSFGSTLIVRGNQELKDFMRLCCRSINEVYYYFGARQIGLRSAFRMLLRTFKYSTRYGYFLEKFGLAFFVKPWLKQ